MSARVDAVIVLDTHKCWVSGDWVFPLDDRRMVVVDGPFAPYEGNGG